MTVAAQHVVAALAAAISVTCSPPPSSRTASDTSDTQDDATISPRNITVSALPGGNGVLDVVALTLRKGQDHAEVYAAVRNVGERPACTAALSVELFDKHAQSLAAGITGLLSAHFYRLTDGSNTIAACISPGDLAVGAITDLPSDLAIDDVDAIVYHCPYYALDVTPIAGLDFRDVRAVAADGKTAYAGTLINQLDVTVTGPSVTVFSLNRVGRPLGVAHGDGTLGIPPSGRWTFETGPVDDPGTDYVAFPAGALHP